MQSHDMQSIKFPGANQADKDLLASLHHLQRLLPKAHADTANQLLDNLSNLEDGTLVAPIVYAWYREFTLEHLVEATEAGLVKIGIKRLGAGWPVWVNLSQGEFSIVTPQHDTSPYTAEGWSLLLNEGSRGLLKIVSPTAEQLEQFSKKVEDALTLFKAIATVQYQTWCDAIRMIVAVAQSADSQISLAGGSSLFLPGVMVVNVDYCSDTLETLATLVHEAAHVQLNSLCSHEPLCLNVAAERFESPLRADARPMEGVIHANYVCATLAELFMQISQSRHCSESREQARKIAEDHYQPLAAQVDQIVEHAQLTAAGQQTLSYMQSVIKNCGELATP